MKFRTEVNCVAKPDFITYRTQMLSVGSCFADEIGLRLKSLDFSIYTNPFGVIFNPVSIAAALKNAVDESNDADFFLERDGLWFNHAYHSQLNAASKAGLIEKISQVNVVVKQHLQQGNLLVLTFGTAWAYRHCATNTVVANCHKVPQQHFSKELLELDALKAMYTGLFQQLFAKNPGLKILLTVSPVRHVRDGLHENNLSKAILLLLTDFLVKRFEQVCYFPAYELVTDDLRDYRFYKEDLIHPTKQAVDYVFEKLAETYFSEKTKQGADLQKSILQLKGHRSITEPSTSNEGVENKVAELTKAFMDLNLK
ncbi:MAG: GSCFA domain-containing protein [Bacteroidetes bacterium]|nr:GSCFA domain-containing protein [Bacteroidota bacterium]